VPSCSAPLLTMYLRPVFLCLAVVGQAIGVKITHPTTGSNWTTTGPNIISWKVEHGDPLFVNIQLVHKNKSSLRPIPGFLPADGIIATGVNARLVEMLFTPSCFPDNPSLPAGSGYSLRFLSGSTNETKSILNSTGNFHIVAANATACVGLNTSTTGSTPSRTSIPSNISTQSDNISSLTSSSHASIVAGGIIGGLALCDLLVCGAIVYNRRQRKARKKRKQQILMHQELVRVKSIESFEFRP